MHLPSLSIFGRLSLVFNFSWRSKLKEENERLQEAWVTLYTALVEARGQSTKLLRSEAGFDAAVFLSVCGALLFHARLGHIIAFVLAALAVRVAFLRGRQVQLREDIKLLDSNAGPLVVSRAFETLEGAGRLCITYVAQKGSDAKHLLGSVRPWKALPTKSLTASAKPPVIRH